MLVGKIQQGSIERECARAGGRIDTSNEVKYALIYCHHNVRSDRRSKMSEGDTTPTATPALPTMYT